MAKITTAVIGVGYLGRFHAQKYALLPDCDLVAVVDTNLKLADAVSRQYHTSSLSDYHELLGKVDAVSIVVPTILHHQIAKDFICNGSHVLVEKPITTSVRQADELISLATRHDRILQVGHIERFNAALLHLHNIHEHPVFIECYRLASYKPRGTDVNVVLDLMIHDIDIILHLVDSEISEIAASGASILSDEIDIVNARLQFTNRCVANVTASRVSMKSERKMRLFLENSYISIDFQDRMLTVYRKGKREIYPGVPEIVSEKITYQDCDALKAEIEHFIYSVQHQTKPIVSGEDGKKALQTAIRISDLIHSHLHTIT